MADVVAYKQTGTNADGVVEIVQYVHPQQAGLARKYLVEEGYTVTEEALTEMPKDTSLDIAPTNQ